MIARTSRQPHEQPSPFVDEPDENAAAPRRPPPPHDPRERELVLTVDDWEVRLFGGRKFQYFVTHGFWHLQLSHPVGQVSVLTPSRLTCGFYEAYPVANWKAQAPDYEGLVALIAGLHVARLPDAATFARLQRAFVDEVVRTYGRSDA